MVKNFDEFINESNVPEKTFLDKLPGGDKRYKKKLDDYFGKAALKFAQQLKKCKTMADLLDLSKEIADYGFQFPITGMLVNGATPKSASLENIKWMDADREGYTSAANLVRNYEKSNNKETYKYYKDTYIISWKWWCANIIRVLFFWESPFDDKNIDEEKLIKLIKQYSPEYMKKNK